MHECNARFMVALPFLYRDHGGKKSAIPCLPRAHGCGIKGTLSWPFPVCCLQLSNHQLLFAICCLLMVSC